MNRPGDPTPNCQGIFPYVLFHIKNNTYIAAAVVKHKAITAIKKMDYKLRKKVLSESK
ncbi:MAG: hypothetical protein WBV84_03230 [Nitrososphaeraceae archaeon]|jgi:hypothetical protein